MSGWLIAIGLGLLLMAALILVGRLPRGAWEITASAMLFGLAGYAWQGHPAWPGAPRQGMSRAAGAFDEALAEKRRGLAERYGTSAQWLMLSDGLGRQGNTQDAANVLISGLRQSPRDANLWIGMGNALIAHGAGAMSPGADYAFRHAMEIDPQAIAPPYFYGLALARNSQLAPARAIWSALAARIPRESALHGELEQNIARIDIMQAGAVAQGR